MTPRMEMQFVQERMSTALKEMSRLSGFDMKRFILSETAAVLKMTAKRVGMPKPEMVDLRSRLRVLMSLGLTGKKPYKGYDITINAGERGPLGRVWFRTQKNKKFQLAHRESKGRAVVGPRNKLHFKSRAWWAIRDAVEEYKGAAEKQIPRGRTSRGWGRMTWIQCGDDLGIPLESFPGGGGLSAAAIAAARRAVPSNGKVVKVGTGTLLQSELGVTVEIINRVSYGEKAGMDRIFLNAMNGRVRYFEENLKRGVFKSQEAIAKKYPGLSVIP